MQQAHLSCLLFCFASLLSGVSGAPTSPRRVAHHIVTHQIMWTPTPHSYKQTQTRLPCRSYASVSWAAGFFMGGSIRWRAVGPLTARFEIVTYWNKNYSIYGNPSARQATLLRLEGIFSPGDGSSYHNVMGNVTDVSMEENWVASVSIVEHTYPQVCARPYGCPRFF